MNPTAQAYLDQVLLKSPENLSKDEIAFLRARKSYLKTSQIEEYSSVLETKPVVTQTVKSHGKSR